MVPRILIHGDYTRFNGLGEKGKDLQKINFTLGLVVKSKKRFQYVGN